MGYCYGFEAERARSDQTSSPNPLIFGATGLILLYDQIWFPCPSFCPSNMRNLPYVKFLDEETRTPLIQSDMESDCAVLTRILEDSPTIFSIGFSEILDSIFGEEFIRAGKIDNHTHGVVLRNLLVGGNCDVRNLVKDTWLIEKFGYLNLDLVLNPFSSIFGTSIFGEEGPVRNYLKDPTTRFLRNYAKTKTSKLLGSGLEDKQQD